MYVFEFRFEMNIFNVSYVIFDEVVVDFVEYVVRKCGDFIFNDF